MLNPATCVNKIKDKFIRDFNLQTITSFSNTPIPENLSNVALIGIKNMKQPSYITLSIKVITNKSLGYESCLKLTNRLIAALNDIEVFSLVDFKTLPTSFNVPNKSFCQEIEVKLKDKTTEGENLLIFDSEKIDPKPQTTLKIERQSINLGSTIGDYQLFEFQNPVRKIEGCAQTNLKQFNNLLEALNSKKIAKISFKNQTFNATLIELSINSNNLVKFKFIETENEI